MKIHTITARRIPARDSALYSLKTVVALALGAAVLTNAPLCAAAVQDLTGSARDVHSIHASLPAEMRPTLMGWDWHKKSKL